MVTVAMSDPCSLESLSVYAPASLSFTPVMMSVVRSSVVSIWNLLLSSSPGSFFPPRDHSIRGAGSPEKAQATVRTFPVSMLISSGRASILGAKPMKYTFIQNDIYPYYNIILKIGMHFNQIDPYLEHCGGLL